MRDETYCEQYNCGQCPKEQPPLQLCPFCGSDARVTDTEGCDWMAHCNKCGAMMGPEFNWGKCEAIENWNKRISP